MDAGAISRSIDHDLPELGRGVIRRYLDPNDPSTASFLAAPDAREQHQTDWHQWGIITHTRRFMDHFHTDVPEYVRAWGVWEPVNAALSRCIDGFTRWQLLQVSILLHDIGKFGARRRQGNRFHFAHHETLSGSIIRHELDLARYSLTPDQIEYVAMTAEDHFVLGLVRKEARGHRAYDDSYVAGPEFAELARRIKGEHPLDFVEVGVLFLGDSLAKVDPRHGPERAVSQYDVNIALARRYLEVVTAGTPEDTEGKAQ